MASASDITWIDGFERPSSADYGYQRSGYFGSQLPTSTDDSWSGSYSLKQTGQGVTAIPTGHDGNTWRPIGATWSTASIGFAFKFTAWANGPVPIVSAVWDSSNCVQCLLNTDGTLAFEGDTNTSSNVTAYALTTDSWYLIGMQASNDSGDNQTYIWVYDSEGVSLGDPMTSNNASARFRAYYQIGGSSFNEAWWINDTSFGSYVAYFDDVFVVQGTDNPWDALGIADISQYRIGHAVPTVTGVGDGGTDEHSRVDDAYTDAGNDYFTIRTANLVHVNYIDDIEPQLDSDDVYTGIAGHIAANYVARLAWVEGDVSDNGKASYAYSTAASTSAIVNATQYGVAATADFSDYRSWRNIPGPYMANTDATWAGENSDIEGFMWGGGCGDSQKVSVHSQYVYLIYSLETATFQSLAGLLTFGGTAWRTSFFDAPATVGTLALTGAPTLTFKLTRFFEGLLTLTGAPQVFIKYYMQLAGLLEFSLGRLQQTAMYGVVASGLISFAGAFRSRKLRFVQAIVSLTTSAKSIVRTILTPTNDDVEMD